MADISIIVPIYNAEKYLQKCLDSLINQTKKEIEIILVNDGSTDDSEKIIKTYHDQRIKYFKNKNQGIGKTRNFGIEKATGKYLMFVDSDDYLAVDACQKLYNKITKEKLDFVICDFYRVEKQQKIKIEIPHFENSTLKENSKLLLTINLSPWNKIYKTKMIRDNNIKFLENVKYEDAVFVINCMKYSKMIGKLDEALNYYVIHTNSETTIRDKKVFDILVVVEEIRKSLKDIDILKADLDTLTISILMNYNIQQRVQEDWVVGKKFIEESFNYLRDNIPDYRKNSYFKTRGIIRTFIEKNEIITKLYCNVYRIIKFKMKVN